MYGERFPEIPHSETLIDHWRDLGLAKIMPLGGYGPFDWHEIKAYSDSTQSDLTPVEALALVDMSRSYAMAIADKNPLSIEPMERA